MVRLAHAHTVDTRPSFPRREGPGDEAKALFDVATIQALLDFEVESI